MNNKKKIYSISLVLIMGIVWVGIYFLGEGRLNIDEFVNGENYINSLNKEEGKNSIALDYGREIDHTLMNHVHGFGLIKDTKDLVVATHTGLFIKSEDGKWYKQSDPNHDYMGFTSSKDYFYTSGHPSPNSGLPNPLGVMRSGDLGKSWESLSLLGKVDFHLMTVGYETNVLYALNNMYEGDALDGKGVYYSENGKDWNKVKLSGYEAMPLSMFAHPTIPGTIILSGGTGTYISRDYGNNFELLNEEFLFTGGDFDKENNIIYATVINAGGDKKFIKMSLLDGSYDELSLPNLPVKEIPAYVAVHPENNKYIWIYTPHKKLFFSQDEGVNWEVLN